MLIFYFYFSTIRAKITPTLRRLEYFVTKKPVLMYGLLIFCNGQATYSQRTSKNKADNAVSFRIVNYYLFIFGLSVLSSK